MSLISIKTNNILYMQAVYLIFHSASVKLLERLCKVKNEVYKAPNFKP